MYLVLLFKNSDNFIVKSIYIFLLLLTSKYASQVVPISELDSITEEYRYVGQYEEAIKYNSNILKQYKTQNFIEGYVVSNLNIGKMLASAGRYKESLIYLNKAKTKINNINNPILYSRLYNEYGRVYFLLKLYNLSNNYLDIAHKTSLRVLNKDIRRKLLYQNYLWRWSNYAELNDTDSLYTIQGKLLRLPPEPIGYIKIAERYLRKKKNLDSVDYYLKKSIILSSEKKFPLHHTALALINLGNLHSIENQKNNSFKYYFKALSISKKIKRTDYILRIYKELSDVYKSINNDEKHEEYYKKYSFLNDSVNHNEKIALYSIVDELHNKKKNYTIYAIGSFFFIIYFTYIIWGFFKNENKKIAQNNINLLRKMKDQEGFSEILEMAEKGNPFFLAKFKNKYPEFHEKLKARCGALTEQDIKFCIYLRLNLDSKQILQYENITLSAIEMRKYRIKKKLKLESNIKLSSWILEL